MIRLESFSRLILALTGLLFAGCTMSPVPPATQPSGMTQQLMMRSLERALARLDIERLKSQTVTVEVFHHAGPETLVKEFIVTWLRAKGVRTVPASPDIKVKAFAGVLGTDDDYSLFGIPAFYTPVFNIPVPEIAFFKWQRSHGVAEVRLYEFDGKTDELVEAPPIATGRAKFDKFTVLLVIRYPESDGGEHE